MKKLKLLKLTSFCIILSLAYACTDNFEPESTSEILQVDSQIKLGGKMVEKSVSYRITNIEGEKPVRNIISATIDGQELTQNDLGEWELKIHYPLVDTYSPAPVNSSFGGDTDCNSQVIDSFELYWTIRSGAPSQLWCHSTVETTCFDTTVEDGVMVTTVTLTTSQTSSPGGCSQSVR